MDECELGIYNCPINSKCVNKPGWYYCQCEQGYRRKLTTDSNNELQIFCEGIRI